MVRQVKTTRKLFFALALVAGVASAEDSRRIAFQTALPANVATGLSASQTVTCPRGVAGKADLL